MAWHPRPVEALRPGQAAPSMRLARLGNALSGGLARGGWTWLSIASAVAVGDAAARVVIGC